MFYFSQLQSKAKPFVFVCEDVVSSEEIEYQTFEIHDGMAKRPLVVVQRIINVGENPSMDEIDESDELQIENTIMDLDGVGSNLEDVLINTLHNYFGYGEFRYLQKTIIEGTLSGRNILGILGTGSGKSLTFMLPAVLSSYPTLVIMPTKSLIDDIVVRCQDLNIVSCKFTGTVPKQIQNDQLENFGSFKLIFATPEMVEGQLLNKIENYNLERVVFDEAHTISTWGNTFRPIYKTVTEQISRLTCPKLLLSATVPAKQQQELNELFGNLVVRDSFFRDNLFLEVRERSRGSKFYDELAAYIEDHDGCGIVYCVFSSDVSKIHSELLKRDINCAKYHGQLSENVKATNFSKWSNGEVRTMVANSAFGMGIDKADVRFVVHARVPTGIDDYYQQCGRAGRDGQHAVCCMFYSHSDKTALLKIFKQHNQFEKQSKLLNDLIIFLEDLVQCRHKSFMSYYGEDRDGFTCSTSCDNSRNSGSFVTTDGTSDGLKVVQAVMELTGKKITFNVLKLYLAGSNQKCIQENNLDSFSTFGSLSNKFVPVVMLQKCLNLLIYYDVLAEVGTLTRNSISINVGLGPNAHKLVNYNFYVPKYEKV